jgi:hypothetical protein
VLLSCGLCAVGDGCCCVSAAWGEEVCADRLKVAANMRAATVLHTNTVAFLLAMLLGL